MAGFVGAAMNEHSHHALELLDPACGWADFSNDPAHAPIIQWKIPGLRRFGDGAMDSSELGQSGIRVPEIGLGIRNHHGSVEPLRAGLCHGALFVGSHGSKPAQRLP